MYIVTFSNNVQMYVSTDKPQEVAEEVCNQWHAHGDEQVTIKSIMKDETPHAGDIERRDQTLCSENFTKSPSKSLDDLEQEIEHELTTYETRHEQNA